MLSSFIYAQRIKYWQHRYYFWDERAQAALTESHEAHQRTQIAIAESHEACARGCDAKTQEECIRFYIAVYYNGAILL